MTVYLGNFVSAFNRKARRILASAMILGAMFVASTAFAGERVMIVFDGSGSMWGQIAGEAKISIARDVLRDVLSSAAPDLELGLMAYGHRKKGQCSDIEIIMQPRAGNADAIAKATDAISPLGKTPLSDSVRIAAEQLNYTEERATVLLITDGIETCSADPCALARELEKGGVNFTTHVVGFGLSAEEGKQVACLAQETGGLYVPAQDADALKEALSERLEDIAAGEPSEIEALPDAEPIKLPEVRISTDETVFIGQTFIVEWDGLEPHNRDVIAIGVPGLEYGDKPNIAGRRVVNGDVAGHEVRLLAPVTPGTYPIFYGHGPSGVAAAVTEIEVVETLVSLDAPAAVAIGRSFQIKWVGPGGNQDYVELVDPRDGGELERIRGKRLRSDDYQNCTVTLEAPAEPGFYQLRYWNNVDGKVLAAREIEILEAEASLDAPMEVSMGTTFQVMWEGPGASRDYVEMLDGADNVVATKRISGGDTANHLVDLIAPTTTGDYTLRYYNGSNRAVLATRPISVTALVVLVDGPAGADIGQVITVKWEGPGAGRDYVGIWDPKAKNGKGGFFHYVRVNAGDLAAQTVDIRTPIVPGDYEIHYYSGNSSTTLATAPLTINMIPVSVTAPASVDAGEVFKATWEGPAAGRDAVEIYDPEGRDGRGASLVLRRLSTGDLDAHTVEIKAPDVPGTYKLRYYNRDNSVALFETDIEIK